MRNVSGKAFHANKIFLVSTKILLYDNLTILKLNSTIPTLKAKFKCCFAKIALNCGAS